MIRGSKLIFAFSIDKLLQVVNVPKARRHRNLACIVRCIFVELLLRCECWDVVVVSVAVDVFPPLCEISVREWIRLKTQLCDCTVYLWGTLRTVESVSELARLINRKVSRGSFHF